MEPRFTRGEYWLLETVVEHELEICALIDNDLELRLNKTDHGLARTSLVETLYRLLSSGLIYAKNEEMGFISTAEQIELALDEPKRGVGVPLNGRKVTYYGLTQEGGAQWEAFAAPDWRKYIAASFQLADDGESEMWELKYFHQLLFGFHRLSPRLWAYQHRFGVKSETADVLYVRGSIFSRTLGHWNDYSSEGETFL